MRLGMGVDEIHDACRIDKWFLEQIKSIVDTEKKVREWGLPDNAPALRGLKAMGFSDRRLAELTGRPPRDVRALRSALGVRPAYKRIDTSAASSLRPPPTCTRPMKCRSPASSPTRRGPPTAGRW